VVVGLDRDIGPGGLGRVEVYYKRFTDLIVGQLETEDQRLARLARYDFPASLQSTLPVAPLITSVPTNDSSGQAYGLDFFLSRADGPAHPRLTGWISYSLATTEQNIYGRSAFTNAAPLSGVNWQQQPLAGRQVRGIGIPRLRLQVCAWPPGDRSRLVPALSGPNRVALQVAPGVAQLNSRACRWSRASI
jgi:hypothetical protein